MKEVEYIQSMQILTMKNNDLLVIKTDRNIDPVTYANIKTAVKLQIPEEIRDKIGLLILSPEMDVGVLRKE